MLKLIFRTFPGSTCALISITVVVISHMTDIRYQVDVSCESGLVYAATAAICRLCDFRAVLFFLHSNDGIDVIPSAFANTLTMRQVCATENGC